jgi:hypothetical protein
MAKTWVGAAFGFMEARGLPGRHSSLPRRAEAVRLHVTNKETTMPASRSVKSSREKVQAHRERLRRKGLRPIQLWVPDVRSRAFVREARRQSLLIAQSAGEADDQMFVDAISEWTGE